MTNACNKCNSSELIIISKNKLIDNICMNCLIEKLNVFDLKEFAFFCRTYGYLWNPELYTRIAQKQTDPIIVLTTYLEELDLIDAPAYSEEADDVWERLSAEWKKVRRYDELVAKVEPIRNSFVERCRVKWGPGFNFEEYIRLEDTFISYVRSYNIQDPIKLDAIKKATIMSVQLDRFSQDADFKGLKEGYAAYKSILDIADIKSLAGVSRDGEIATMSDLYKYMEKNGFEFRFYDQAPRDDVDFAIENIKESLRTTIKNNTGMADILQEVHDKYIKTQDETTEEEAVEELTSESIAEFYDKETAEIDSELGSEGIVIDDGLEY